MRIGLSELKKYIQNEVKTILSEAGEKVYVKGAKAAAAKKSGHEILKSAKGGMYYVKPGLSAAAYNKKKEKKSYRSRRIKSHFKNDITIIYSNSFFTSLINTYY